MSPGVIIGIAWFQLAFGCAYFVWGLKSKGSPGTQFFAPLGLLFMIGGAFRLLDGRIPDSVFITLYVSSFAAVSVWLVRVHRAFKARLRELVKQREQLKP